jgi:hypothetical protein
MKFKNMSSDTVSMTVYNDAFPGGKQLVVWLPGEVKEHMLLVSERLVLNEVPQCVVVDDSTPLGVAPPEAPAEPAADPKKK